MSPEGFEVFIIRMLSALTGCLSPSCHALSLQSYWLAGLGILYCGFQKNYKLEFMKNFWLKVQIQFWLFSLSVLTESCQGLAREMLRESLTLTNTIRAEKRKDGDKYF